MADQDGQRISTLGTKWVRKMVIILLLAVGLGVWGLYDATIKYPQKGRDFAEWAEYQYLVALADESATQRDPGIITRSARVDDPDAELARLRSDPAAAAARPSMQARREWLEALSVVGLLEPEHTDFDETPPRERLAELQAKWGTTTRPARLHSYDLPFQWGITAVGFGLALYLLYLMARVAATRYRWEPERKALTLPGGATITPADLQEVDKRKWDKFIVFLRIKPEASAIPGRTVRVDTYRHAHVEEWILEMEREAFGTDEPTGEAPTPERQPDAEPEPADEKG